MIGVDGRTRKSAKSVAITKRQRGEGLTKEELKQISANNRKLVRLKNKYEALRYKSQMKGQVLTGMPHVSGVKDGVGDYVIEMTDLKGEIDLLERTNQMLIAKARRYIENIPDWVIQMIFELKYINNLYVSEIIPMLGVKEIRKEKDIYCIIDTFFFEQLLYM